MQIDIVVTRHRPLVTWLREQGIIDDTTPVIEHATISDVAGKHVLGVLPHWLSSKAASVTEVEMSGLTAADREAMTRGDLSIERMREVAGAVRTYQVFGGDKYERLHAIHAAAEADNAWLPSRFLAVTILVFARTMQGEHSWGDRWNPADDRATKAKKAARGQIPYDLTGPRLDYMPTDGDVVKWSTCCNHETAEADVRRGLFRAWASGPGYTPWIDVETLRLYDSQADYDREQAAVYRAPESNSPTA
jgi:hypothetical protein